MIRAASNFSSLEFIDVLLEASPSTVASTSTSTRIGGVNARSVIINNNRNNTEEEEEEEDDDDEIYPVNEGGGPTASTSGTSSSVNPSYSIYTGGDIYKFASKYNRREIGDSAIWTLSSCKSGFSVHQLRDDNLDTFWQSDGPQPHSVNIQFVGQSSLTTTSTTTSTTSHNTSLTTTSGCSQKAWVREIALYLDYKQDESYTPSRISIRAGNNFQDLVELVQLNLEEPAAASGWIIIPLDDVHARPCDNGLLSMMQQDDDDDDVENEGYDNGDFDESESVGGNLSSSRLHRGKGIYTHLIQIAILLNHQNGRDSHIRLIKIFSQNRDEPSSVSVGPTTKSYRSHHSHRDVEETSTCLSEFGIIR